MQLTKAEEQVMQHLWSMGEGLVKDIRDCFDEPSPVRNTISTVIRILEKKDFVAHKTYGNVNVYYPLVSKNEYSGNQLLSLMNNYFDNSFPALTSFFVREKDLSLTDFEQIIKETRIELTKD